MNYILGTQHMTNETIPIIKDMGMNQVKITDTDPCFLDIIDIPQFEYIFIWFRSRAPNFTNCFTPDESDSEYNAVYNFVCDMLHKYNGTRKHFYLGNRKGDYDILDFMDTTQNANSEKINKVINWVNIRQKAVSDARKHINSTVKFYYYLELNRVVDAYNLKLSRIVNHVLPFVTIDYVSYSSHESQEYSLELCKTLIEYIKTNMKCTTDYPVTTASRIFIGDFGTTPTSNDSKHAIDNLMVYLKYLKLGMPFILYSDRGMWLNRKSKLYYSLVEYHIMANEYLGYLGSLTECEFRDNVAIPTIESLIKKLRS